MSLFLNPTPFVVGQKIRIEGGKRHGDWEVVKVSEAKVGLRCPISGRGIRVGAFLLPGSRAQKCPMAGSILKFGARHTGFPIE